MALYLVGHSSVSRSVFLVSLKPVPSTSYIELDGRRATLTSDVLPLDFGLLQLDIAQAERDKVLLGLGKVEGRQLERKLGRTIRNVFQWAFERKHLFGRRGADGRLLHGPVDEVPKVGGEVSLGKGGEGDVVEGGREPQRRRCRLALDQTREKLCDRWFTI
jgi:hypothetical protein